MTLKRCLMCALALMFAMTVCDRSASALDVAQNGKVRTAIRYKQGSDEKVQHGAEELAACWVK